MCYFSGEFPYAADTGMADNDDRTNLTHDTAMEAYGTLDNDDIPADDKGERSPNLFSVTLPVILKLGSLAR